MKSGPVQSPSLLSRMVSAALLNSTLILCKLLEPNQSNALFFADPAVLFSPAAMNRFTNIKVVIEATTGPGYTGDIAIDDVVITEGSCGE